MISISRLSSGGIAELTNIEGSLMSSSLDLSNPESLTVLLLADGKRVRRGR